MSDAFTTVINMEIPAAWRRRIHPRRGGVPAPKVKIDKAAAAEWLRVAEERGRAVIGSTVDPPDLLPEAVAAAIALGALKSQETYLTKRWDGFVDGWVVEHGLVFAARAFTAVCMAGPTEIENEPQFLPAAQRLRRMVAAADDETYQAVTEGLAEMRVSRVAFLLSAYLVPTRTDWVDACIAVAPPGYAARQLLWCSLGSAQQLEVLGPWAELNYMDCSLDVLATLAEGVGPAIAPLLARGLDDRWLDAERTKALFTVLTAIPSDEAIELLILRAEIPRFRSALMEMMERFPERALRVLAGSSESVAGELLVLHARVHRDLVAGLPDDLREIAERALGDAGRRPEIPVGDLPGVLSEPWWTKAPAEEKPVVIKGLTPPDVLVVEWADGERDDWARRQIDLPTDWLRPSAGRGGITVGVDRLPKTAPEVWEQRVAEYRSRGLSGDEEVALFAMGPDEMVRPLVGDWKLNDQAYSSAAYRPERWAPRIVARFEAGAVAFALRLARAKPAQSAWLLLPFLNAEIATQMADWLVRSKTARESVDAWFERHGAGAIELLIPTAVGKPGAQRRASGYALHGLASSHGEAAVLDAAGQYGDQAVATIKALLAADPHELLPPRKIPELARWADPANLPQILVRDGSDGPGRALPAQSTSHLLRALALSEPGGEVEAAIEMVRELCDPASLAEFAWAVFELWREHGEPVSDAWALMALGFLGDDEVARKLTPTIREWPGLGGHHKAVKGLDVLALIGTEVALTQLHGIAQRVKFKALKERAGEKIEQVAEGLGLTGDQLGDRLVPGFGLDADGGMVLDYGPRRFVVGFDEQLKPFVKDEDGKLRKALPKPGAKDDPDLAPATYATFAQLKKDVRAVASIELQRMELAMATGRRWSAADFQTYLVGHPLTWHIVRRLVWLAEAGDGTTTGFRVAEDRTFADLDDEAFALPSDAEVAVAHPLHLGDAVAAWEEMFTDYEIVQPFPQLRRPVHALTDDERTSARLTRFEGLSVPFGDVLRLVKRGWRRGEPQDNGTERWIYRPVPGDLYVLVNLNPGIQVGVVDLDPEQKLEYVWIGDRLSDYWRSHDDGRHTFAELDPVTAAEILTDLISLNGNP
ncbi:DUF4132 domain-containing protein [Actinomadura sp. 6N118]|uniref:DUF4132 domain-containing protein n=1 Tax=Actinomadura sp. 6N118 TaxID=3375151 RepID=UPI0037B1280A